MLFYSCILSNKQFWSYADGQILPGDAYYLTRNVNLLIDRMSPEEVTTTLNRIEWLYAPGHEILTGVEQVKGSTKVKQVSE